MTHSSERDEPLYRELAEDLRQAIKSGRLIPGSPLPTEADLAAQYQVSRNTVRLALGALTGEGLITAGRGRGGRRVQRREPLEYYASRSESMDRADERQIVGVDAWVADNRDLGRDGTQHITVEIEQAPPDIAKRLDLDIDQPVVVRRRIRFSNGEPHNLNDTWYPADIAEGTPIMHPADVPQGTIALMRELGYAQVRYIDEVETRMPNPNEIHRLRIPQGFPVIVQTRVGHTTERPVKVTVTIWPGDRTKLIYELPA